MMVKAGDTAKLGANQVAGRLGCDREAVAEMFESGSIPTEKRDGERFVRSEAFEEWLRGTAYHEAAHTVVAFVLGRPLAYVTVVPHYHEGSLCAGLAMCRDETKYAATDRSPEALDWFEKKIATSVAGGYAEERVVRDFDRWGTISDNRNAEYWAQALVDSDDPDLVNACIEQVAERTLKMVNIHWGKIDALAQALVRQGRLEGEEVEAVLLGAPERSFGSTAPSILNKGN